MRILWCIHLFPPFHNCGSEAVAHAVSKYLISKGHQVRVILMQAGMHNIKVPYTYEGVEVFGPPTSIDGYLWGDVFMTHLDFTQHTIQWGVMCERPVINFIHNSHPYESIMNAMKNNYVVYNSQWIADKLNYQHPAMVFNPPCDWRQYDLGKDPYKNEFITLINLDENKGGKILRRLAKAMPDKKFMAVKGSYSEPAQIGQVVDQPSNVTIVPNSPDIIQVYARTRILIMPSRYESWGRTATESMCNGIPIICTPTPGLKENCQDAALYVPERGPIERDKTNGAVLIDDGETYDIEPMVKHIRRLDDKKFYAKRSALARDRSRDLDPLRKMADLEDFIIQAGRNPYQVIKRRMNYV